MFRNIFLKRQQGLFKNQSKKLIYPYQDVLLLLEIITEQQQIINELFKQNKEEGFQNKLLKSRANFDAFDIKQLKELFITNTSTI